MAENGKFALKLAVRKLWADHVIWTRQYVVAAVAGTLDAEAAAGRLLKNQEDIGNAIVPYYGKAAGDGLTGVLKQHILIAVDLIAAAKAAFNPSVSWWEDPTFVRAANAWDANADEIATFLSKANPNWPKKDIADLLALHLRLTKGEVVARLQKDWVADVKAFDDIFTEAIVIADTLSDGIVKQFAGKF